MIAVQNKTIENDYADLLKEFGECDELSFAILAHCICVHLNEMQKFEDMYRKGTREMCASFKILQKRLIESIPEDLIAFSEEDKNI